MGEGEFVSIQQPKLTFSKLVWFLTVHATDVTLFLKCSAPKFGIGLLIPIDCRTLSEIQLFL